MPRVELRDPFGMSYQVTTLDADLLERWLREWLPRLYPPEMPDALGDPLVIVHPLFDQQKRPDWVTYSPLINTWHTIPRDPAQAMTALAELRGRLERDAADMEARRHGR